MANKRLDTRQEILPWIYQPTFDHLQHIYPRIGSTGIFIAICLNLCGKRIGDGKQEARYQAGDTPLDLPAYLRPSTTHISTHN